MVTDEKLKTWRHVSENVSAGEWTFVITDGVTRHDRAFIDAAREAVPALLDEIERLKADYHSHLLRTHEYKILADARAKRGKQNYMKISPEVLYQIMVDYDKALVEIARLKIEIENKERSND